MKPLSGRRFYAVTTVYALVVLVVLAMSAISRGDAQNDLYVGATVLTMPVGILWYLGGASILFSVAGLLEATWLANVLIFAAFAAAAVFNAVLLHELADLMRHHRQSSK